MRYASGDRVQYEECFSAGDRAARSTDMISWGPHNVLQVSMRWSVKFFVDTLLTPSSEVSLRQHPLAYRPDDASEEVVTGAKWALGLVPEVRYPAEARICVATNANLIVYRVIRQGNNKTRVSKGIGIGLCFSTADISIDNQAPRKGARESKQGGQKPPRSSAEAASPFKTTPLMPRGVKTDAHKGQDSLRKEGVGEGSISTTQGLTVGLSDAPAQQHEKELSDKYVDSAEKNGNAKRERPRPSPPRKRAKGSTKDPSPKKQKSQGGSQAPSPWRRKISSGESQQGLSSDTRYQHPLVDYFWLVEDSLLVITTDGVYLVNFVENFSDEVIPQLLTLPVALYDFQRDILGVEMAHPSAAAMVRCSCEVASSMRECRVFSSVSDRVLIVASAFVLRILHVSDEKVQLVHYVEVPSLAAVPSCLCSFWGQISSTTLGENPRHSHLSVEASQNNGKPSSVQVRVIIATTLGVEYGYFLLDLTFFQPKQVRDYDTGALGTSWISLPTDVPEGIIEHLFLRGIYLIALEDLKPFCFSHSSTSDASTALPQVSPWAVLGVSRQCLFALILGTDDNKITLLPLFRCPSLAASTEAPVDAAIAICGISVHTSSTLAVAAVQMGCHQHEPLQLYPVPVDAKGGILHRLLELHDVLTFPTTNGEPSEGSSRNTTTTSPRKSVGTVTASEDSLAIVLMKQRRNSYFPWEMLCPMSHDIISMRSYRESWRRFHAALSSGTHVPASHSPTTTRKAEVWGSPLFLTNGVGGMVEEMVSQWRRQYIQLRKQYGAELFLRYLPPTDEAVGREEDWYLQAIAADLGGSTLERYWWAILRSLWRRCPFDATPLYEIILANAIRVIAVRAGYAMLQLSGEETFWQMETQRGPSVSAYELNYSGAVAFAHLYLRELKKGLQGETAGCSALALWCCTTAWAESLQSFLLKLGVSEVDELLLSRIYPCSVCDTAQAACFSWSFMFDSKHAVNEGGRAHSFPSAGVQEVHTTVFSPKTFSPLSLYSEVGVLTSCLGCGFCDFAVGPFCRICGGLLK